MTVTIHAIMDVPVPSPARRAAFLVLSQVARKEGEPVGLLHGPATRGLSRADLRLTTELVYGVLRWQATLDYVLEVHARRPVERMDLPALLSLRIGLYQIRHLSGVPERAAVDEAVKLTRAYRHRGATGFVNAVLRSVCRRPEFPPLPSKDDDPLSYLAITLSHPRWLARRWLQRLGTEAAARRCRSDNQPPPTDLRIEPPLSAEEASLELAAEGIRGAPFAAVPGCVRVHSGSLSESSLVREGRAHIQEAGSQLIPFLLDVREGDCVLDACAAPGSKATEIARWSRPGVVIAADRRPKRLRQMLPLVRRLNRDNVLLLGADAATPPFRTPFRRILLDAPCSSLGTLRRNPDIKWRLSEEDLGAHAATERGLLESCAGILAPGGTLVYATCSTEPEENEELVSDFLGGHPDFRILPPPASFPEQARSRVGDDGALRTFPERDDMDGYYAVLLSRSLT